MLGHRMPMLFLFDAMAKVTLVRSPPSPRFLFLFFFSFSCLILLCDVVVCDVYLHNPRGSNNRLNEQNAERNNADRLFNSQNNNRGGYNVGDKTATANDGSVLTIGSSVAPLYSTVQGKPYQYPMLFYEGSVISVEWTNQHGCGGQETNDPTTQNCNFIIQYACEMQQGATSPNNPPGVNVYTEGTLQSASGTYVTGMWDGTNTNQQNQPTTLNTAPSQQEGLHESTNYYVRCENRQRNNGLFTADQQLNGNTAQFTRQNPNGNRNGLECPEERDYYPYWAPSPWRDVVILTDHVEFCPMYLNTSQNTVPVGRCEANSGTPTSGPNPYSYMRAITESDCVVNYLGTWVLYSHGIAPPECIQSPWSRPNHLGNTRFGLTPNMYNWTLPTVSSIFGAALGPEQTAKCVLRLRYNISTDDYDPWNTFASSNDNPAAGIYSPVKTNPVIDIGAYPYAPNGPNDPTWRGVKLNVNTAQFGRVFQDRSHIFYIRQVPTPTTSLGALLQGKRILNLNVRGKRGNIAQTYPAVEYDFVPGRLHVNPQSDIVHLQWTGSNTHNNNGGGDGQGGDQGQGNEGTDRNNFALMSNFSNNFPLPLDKFPNNMFASSNSACFSGWDGSAIGGSSPSSKISDCSVYLATSSFFTSVATVSTATPFDPLLNNAPPSLPAGVFIQFNTPTSTTEYYYMCTRNNNFSNRSQKGTIVVLGPTPTIPPPPTAAPTTTTPTATVPTTTTAPTAAPTAAPTTTTAPTAAPTTTTAPTAAPTTTAAPTAAPTSTSAPTTVTPTTASPTSSASPTTASAPTSSSAPSTSSPSSSQR